MPIRAGGAILARKFGCIAILPRAETRTLLCNVVAACAVVIVISTPKEFSKNWVVPVMAVSTPSMKVATVHERFLDAFGLDMPSG